MHIPCVSRTPSPEPKSQQQPPASRDSDSQRSSMSSGPKPSHHAKNGGFQNPWPSAAAPTWSELMSGGGMLGWAKHEKELKDDGQSREIKVVEPDWGRGRGATARGGRGDRENVPNGLRQGVELLLGTWLGHAGAFVEVPLEKDSQGNSRSAKLLFDPIFSGTAGPTAYTGPKRYRKSPCEVEDLPGCDAVFISHNHYDHLDLSSIQAIMKHYPSARYFVPLGNKSWFMNTGVAEEQIKEMDWWDDCELCPEELGYPLKEGELSVEDQEPTASRLRFTCVPAQHNSGRTGIDSGSTLWAGWVVEHLVTSQPSKAGDDSTRRVTRKGAVFFAGDTGYRRHRTSKAICPIFEELGKKFGPFDLSFLPIWRGGSLSFVSWLGLRLHHENIPSALHGSPTDAVSMHLDVRSRNSVGVHFGTFIGTENESLEAIIELNQACNEAGVRPLEDDKEKPDHGGEDKGRFGVIDLGETVVVEVEEIVIVS